TRASRDLASAQAAMQRATDAGDLAAQVTAQEQIVQAMRRRIGEQLRLNAIEGSVAGGAGLKDMYKRLNEAREALAKLTGKQQDLTALEDQAGQWRDLIARMEEQVATYGMSNRAAEIWRATQEGATQAVIEQLRELDAELGRLEERENMRANIRKQFDGVA